MSHARGQAEAALVNGVTGKDGAFPSEARLRSCNSGVFPASLQRHRVERFTALDGWRGVAAIMVALFHFPPVFRGAEFFVIRQGWLFVDFFFVLSGFVITHANSTEIAAATQLRRFLLRRFFRLYPLHIAMLAMLLVLASAIDGMRWFAARHSSLVNGTRLFYHLTPTRVSKHLLLLQGFSPLDDIDFNSPSWSISVEFWVYVLFGMAALFFRTRGRGWKVTAAVFFVAWYVWLPTALQATWGNLFRCLAGFSAGSALYFVLEDWRPPALSRGLFTGLEVGAVGLMLAFIASVGSGVSSRAAAVVFGFVVAVFSFEAGLLSAWLCSPVAATMGALSYATYMVHGTVILVMKTMLLGLSRLSGVDAATSPALGLAVVVAYLALVWLTARQAHVWIETPGRSLAWRFVPEAQPSRASVGNAVDAARSAEPTWTEHLPPIRSPVA